MNKIGNTYYTYNTIAAMPLAEYKWLVKNKYFLSPDKKHYGGFLCEWKQDKFLVTVIILDKNENEIGRKEIVNVTPSFGEYYIGAKAKWNDANTFTLISNYENIIWRLIINENNSISIKIEKLDER